MLAPKAASVPTSFQTTHARGATTAQGSPRIHLRGLPSFQCEGACGHGQEQRARLQRPRKENPQALVEVTGAALPDLRQGHRLLAAERTPVELRGRREDSRIARRQPAVAREHWTSAQIMQHLEERDDARGSPCPPGRTRSASRDAALWQVGLRASRGPCQGVASRRTRGHTLPWATG